MGCGWHHWTSAVVLLQPAVRVARMSLVEVLDNLREEGIWFDGTDWSKKREALHLTVGIGQSDPKRRHSVARDHPLSLIPVLDPSRQLPQIPHVPETVTHLPPSSLDVLGAGHTYGAAHLVTATFVQWPIWPGGRPDLSACRGACLTMVMSPTTTGQRLPVTCWSKH